MNLLSIGTGYLILFLFIINFLVVLLIRSEGRFWYTGVVLWIFMFFIVVLFNVMNNLEVDKQEIAYSKTQTVDDQQEFQLQYLRDQTSRENIKLFRLLGFQTIFSCVWQLLGFSTTGKRYYRTSAISFTLLSIVFGITELLRIF